MPSAWARELGSQYVMDEADWNKVCLAVFRVSICSKKRYFQYCLIHRRLTTNLHRSKWCPDVSPECTFCLQHTETLSHLLWYCPKVKKFWSALLKWLKYIHVCKLDTMDFDVHTVIFNNYKGANNWLVNTILLIVKQYIYSCTCQKWNLSLLPVVTKIRGYQSLEESIARSKKKINKHEKKWEVFKIIYNMYCIII